MALKGTTLVELTDVKTGQVERFEDTNTLTDAIYKILKPYGYMKGQGAHYNVSNFAASFMGGIILFDGEIDDVNPPLFAPSDVSAVGYAAYNHTNATTDTALGSWNSTETVVNNEERYLKLVYDFATSQANGTIKCACLTHPDAAIYTMYGSPKSVQDNTENTNALYTYPNPGLSAIRSGSEFSGTSFSMGAEHPFLIDQDEDIVYYFTMPSTNSIRIIKRRGNILSIPAAVNHKSHMDIVQQFDIELAGAVSVAYVARNYDFSTQKLYLCCSGSSSIPAGGSFHVVEVDLENRTASVVLVQNTSGVALRSSDNLFAYVHHELVYMIGNASPNNTKAFTYRLDVKSWKVLDGNLSSSNCRPVLGLNGNVFYYHFYNATVSSSDRWYLNIANGEQNVIKRPGATSLLLEDPNWIPFRDGLHFGVTSQNIVFPKNYLATVNNLTQPIVKTEDKTMKITYTIQEV